MRQTMVSRLIAAFDRRHRRPRLDVAATKTKAKAKLAVLKVGVGYPDTWRDYTALSIVNGDALGNSERARSFEYRRSLAQAAARRSIAASG